MKRASAPAGAHSSQLAQKPGAEIRRREPRPNAFIVLPWIGARESPGADMGAYVSRCQTGMAVDIGERLAIGIEHFEACVYGLNGHGDGAV